MTTMTIKAIATAVVLFATACAAEAGGDEDMSTVDVAVAVEALTACEWNSQNTAQKAFNKFLGNMQNCGVWSYNSGTHIITKDYTGCSPTHVFEPTKVYGNSPNNTQWNWVSNSPSKRLDCHCDGVNGNGVCQWIY